MSKSKGNVVDPWDVIDEHGADAFRWYLFTSSPPGDSRRFSVDLVGEVVRKFWSTLWNTYSFFVTYANLDKWTPDQDAPPVAERDLLDQWVLAELHNLTRRVTEAMETYDVTNATRPVQEFVEALSNWYVRLNRRRFWKSESDSDKMAAYATLYECLVTVSKLIAPAMPFLAEELYTNLVTEVDSSAPNSVHLAQWPAYDEALINQALIDEMELVQRLVSLGLAARMNNEENGAKAPIGVRQPLANALFGLRSSGEREVVTRYSELIRDELNVKALDLLEGGGDVIRYALNPLPQMLGKKLGKDFPRVQKALREGEAADVRTWAETLLSGGNVSLTLDGDTFEVTPEEVEVKQQAAEGYAVAAERGYVAAVNVTLNDDLVNEGLAREVVRRIQSMRRDADFDIADHITIVYSASDTLKTAIQQFTDYIKAETLATEMDEAEPDNGYFKAEFLPHEDSKKDTSIRGERLALGVKRNK
ncbi:MAG: hypothetical protein OHK0046_01110 [Anaerolineae bacterium]